MIGGIYLSTKMYILQLNLPQQKKSDQNVRPLIFYISLHKYVDLVNKNAFRIMVSLKTIMATF